MRTSWIAPVAALFVASAPAAQAQTQNQTQPPSTKQAQPQTPNQTRRPSHADNDFVQQALKAGEEEVALSKLAADKSQSEQVKQFAQMIVSDHTAANEQLSLLSQRDGAPPRDSTKRSTDSSPPATSPGAAPSSPKAQQLSKLSGSNFDKQFLLAVVQDHQKAIELFAHESERGSDPAVKKFATETLPKLKDHLQQAKSLQQQSMDKKTQ